MTKHIAERKKLLKRFTGFRRIIGDEISTLDPALIARLDRTVEALQAPVRVVIAGLADARHHALASSLCGTPLVTGENAVMACPSLLIRAGTEARTVTEVAGQERVFRGCVLDKLIEMDTQHPVTLVLPDLTLPHVELSVLPVYDSQDDRSRYLFDMIERSDALVWCSDAAQPWQPRERRLWFTVPDDLKSLSILAMSESEAQADTDDARTARDDKIEITKDEFAHTVTVSYDAQGKAQDVTALIAALAALVDEPILAEARALRTELDAIPIGGAVAATAGPAPALPPARQAAPSPDAVTATAPPAAPSPADMRLLLIRHASACMEAVENTTAADRGDVFDAMSALLTGAATALKGDVTLSRDHGPIAAQLDEANDLVNLLGYEGTALAVQEAADLVCQIATDILDRLPVTDAAEQTDATPFRKAS